MLCIECDKRGVCQTLCPEAELYINQDYTPKSELTLTEICVISSGKVHQDNIKKWPEIEIRPSYTKREREILAAWGNGKTRKQIAKTLTISISTVHTHIGNIRKKNARLLQ